MIKYSHISESPETKDTSDGTFVFYETNSEMKVRHSAIYFVETFFEYLGNREDRFELDRVVFKEKDSSFSHQRVRLLLKLIISFMQFGDITTMR